MDASDKADTACGLAVAFALAMAAFSGCGNHPGEMLVCLLAAAGFSIMGTG